VASARLPRSGAGAWAGIVTDGGSLLSTRTGIVLAPQARLVPPPINTSSKRNLDGMTGAYGQPGDRPNCRLK
jgi:hypothetical protein